jgi:hypothetical protein
MTAVSTQRHPFYFYFVFVASAIIAILWCVVLCGMLYGDVIQHNIENGRIVLTVVATLFSLYVTINHILRYASNAPSAKIDQEKLIIGSQTYRWSDIERIELTGKKPCRYFGNLPLEGIGFYFKDCTVKYLFDYYYSNSSEIKLFIQKEVLNQEEATNSTSPQNGDLQSKVFKTFKGYLLISFWGVMFIVVLFFIALEFLNVATTKTFSIALFGCLALIIIYAHCAMFHYFKVSDSHLVVKNHIYFWKNDSFSLEHIKEIVFDQYGRLPNGFRVIDNDFKSRRYLAATLSNKKWRELQQELEDKGVKVRNELTLTW